MRWFQAAVAAHPGNLAAHNNLGLALLDQGGPGRGHRRVPGGDPARPEVRPRPLQPGDRPAAKGDLDGAIAAFQEAIRLDPKHAAAHNNLGVALQDKGDLDGAIAAFQEAIRLDPKYAVAHNNLAWLLAVGPDGVRDGKQAVEHATRACELSGWNEPDCSRHPGRRPRRGRGLRPGRRVPEEGPLLPGLPEAIGQGGRDRLELYARKKPYRDPASGPRADGRQPPPRKVKPCAGADWSSRRPGVIEPRH